MVQNVQICKNAYIWCTPPAQLQYHITYKMNAVMKTEMNYSKQCNNVQVNTNYAQTICHITHQNQTHGL